MSRKVFWILLFVALAAILSLNDMAPLDLEQLEILLAEVLP